MINNFQSINQLISTYFGWWCLSYVLALMYSVNYYWTKKSILNLTESLFYHIFDHLNCFSLLLPIASSPLLFYLTHLMMVCYLRLYLLRHFDSYHFITTTQMFFPFKKGGSSVTELFFSKCREKIKCSNIYQTERANLAFRFSEHELVQ